MRTVVCTVCATDVLNLVRGAGTGGTTAAGGCFSLSEYVPGSNTGGYSNSPPAGIVCDTIKWLNQ